VESKIVLGTKDGKTYNIEAKDEGTALFLGKSIGDVVNATPLGLKGYEIKITGGSDKSGFPMRRDINRSGRASALLTTRGVGYRPEEDGVRKRKTVVGTVIDDNISQINAQVVKAGNDPIEKLIGGDKAAEEPTEK
jgi:small subunit ribosomal protein S6e